MVGFVTYRTAYRCNAVRKTMILRIDEIAVSPRGAGVPDFESKRRTIETVDLELRLTTSRPRPTWLATRHTGSRTKRRGQPPPRSLCRRRPGAGRSLQAVATEGLITSVTLCRHVAPLVTSLVEGGHVGVDQAR
jgi:hypothetical protein